MVRSVFGDKFNDGDRSLIQIFSPDGKMGMIDGGIGCVRLKPRPNRSDFRWFLGASSNGIVHEGIIVALNDEQRDCLIADIRKLGGLKCSITGKLQFFSSDDPLSRGFGRRVPQLYLEAHRVKASVGTRRRPEQCPRVTAIVTFASKMDEWRGLNASYVTFESGKRGAVDEAADWLEKVYVGAAYSGRVLTDFDEQTKRFESATFSLSKLLNGLVDRNEARSTFEQLALTGTQSDWLEEILNRRGIFVVRDLFIAQQAGAMGPSAAPSNVTFSNMTRGRPREKTEDE